MEEKSAATVKISVRNLVEFILRSGDISSAGFASPARALEGTWAHQKIQKKWSDVVTKEVSLSYQVETPEFVLKIIGRADGVRTAGDHVTLIEIKSTTSDLDDLDEHSHPLYWAQAKCYAFIYAKQNNLSQIDIQLIYAQIETGESKLLEKHFLLTDLERFFYDLVERYLAWAQRMQKWVALRNESIKELQFPFPAYRKGQRELAVAVYRTITADPGKKLFAQAPTGIGKTMATLFPAIKAMGEGHLEKIFYLTAKTVARELAENAVAKLAARGLAFKPLTLTAKEKICFTPGCECNPDQCEFAKGHFDRVNQALEDIFDEPAFPRTVIETYARKHRVCPFEFALDLSLWSDAVICDYNYVFDPKVFLKRFFMDTGGNYAFLVDEAHNLVDRAREMFSAELDKKPIQELKAKIKDELPHVAKHLTKINTLLTKAKKLCQGTDQEKLFYVQKEPYKDLFSPLKKFMKSAETWLVQNKPAEFREELVEFYFTANDFIRVSETYDHRYATYIQLAGRDLKVKMFCIDPSFLLSEALKRGRCAVFFSATLTPLDYFRQILGGDENDRIMKIPSPFPRENLCLMVADNIKTTFRARELTYHQIVDVIAAVTSSKTGNFLVYLPSYKYLNEISSRFVAAHPAVKVICQSSGMSESEKENFLAAFSAENSETLVGFAVMGGVFGEGIDLVGDRLSGCVIVGVGLPQIGLERDIIRNHFDQTLHLGFEFAYMYPGMNKVLQAAGRVIRTETDRGAVLLIDERFNRQAYRALFPSSWLPSVPVRSPEQITQVLGEFWI